MHTEKHPRPQNNVKDKPRRTEPQARVQNTPTGNKPKRPSIRHVAVLGYN